MAFGRHRNVGVLAGRFVRAGVAVGSVSADVAQSAHFQHVGRLQQVRDAFLIDHDLALWQLHIE